MQKVINRSIQAEKQAARRLARKQQTQKRVLAKISREEAEAVRKEVAANIKDERTVRREDWELGPLAPRRDVGDRKETHGTISQRMYLFGKELDIEGRVKLNPTGGRFPNIVEGDRVVLLEGKDRGKIGEVTKLDVKKQQVTVKGLNKADLAIPKFLRDNREMEKQYFTTIEMPISLAAVKLVFPLADPETGITRDVIIREIQNSGATRDRITGRLRYKRRIAGLGTILPWPQKPPKEHKNHEDDTLRIDVEAKTFVPTLLKPPMPTSVIDELRNKYSKFRTRHDEEYVRKKTQEDEEKKALNRAVSDMRSPVYEANKRDRKLRKALGKGKLTDDMLASIGEIMSRNKGLGEGSSTSEVAV